MTQVYSMPIKGDCQLYACINGEIDNVDLIDELEDFAIAQRVTITDPTAIAEFVETWIQNLVEPVNEK